MRSDTRLGKLYLSRENINVVARPESWDMRDGKKYILFSVLDLGSVTDWVGGAASEDDFFRELYFYGPFDTLADAAAERKRQLEGSKVVQRPRIRITVYHEYTPNAMSYPPGSTPEQMLEIDRRDDGPLEIMESAIADGTVTVQMEVVREK
jgi:hypothetical protein